MQTLPHCGKAVRFRRNLRVVPHRFSFRKIQRHTHWSKRSREKSPLRFLRLRQMIDTETPDRKVQLTAFGQSRNRVMNADLYFEEYSGIAAIEKSILQGGYIMCTGLSFANGNSHYFGRNLDLEIDYPVDVVITPRNHPFRFRNADGLKTHNAIIGMGLVQNDYPLYFEGVNDKGLGMAGLAFWTSCHYFPVQEGKLNLASFEILQYILGKCSTVEEAKEEFKNINITNVGFSSAMAPSPLHWLISDANSSIVVEQTEAHGLMVYDDPFNVLTNEPEFPFHEKNLSFYCNVSNHLENFSETRFAPNFPDFIKMGAGMGTSGLPGGLDSMSRFVRVAFTRLNSVCSNETEECSIQQFFHILSSVYQTNGCDQVKPGEYEVTQYSCGANLETGRFYYTTYSNQSITAVDLHKEDLDSDRIVSYPVKRDLRVELQN